MPKKSTIWFQNRSFLNTPNHQSIYVYTINFLSFKLADILGFKLVIQCLGLESKQLNIQTFWGNWPICGGCDDVACVMILMTTYVNDTVPLIVVHCSPLDCFNRLLRRSRTVRVRLTDQWNSETENSQHRLSGASTRVLAARAHHSACIRDNSHFEITARLQRTYAPLRIYQL